jgi:hypothetical protein
MTFILNSKQASKSYTLPILCNILPHPGVKRLMLVNSSSVLLPYHFQTLIMLSMFQYNFCFALIPNSGSKKHVPSKLTLGVTSTQCKYDSSKAIVMVLLLLYSR